ncbi:MAG TPA: autotransporter outer membrane beta-barrel domain-containing protein [Acetobacteraceae bacterium]|nr:autotransporter outer membrane beta-barrel domain-containing protein [Acetobacteraceae bacterium]
MFEAGASFGIVGHQVDTFLFEPGSQRYLERLCSPDWFLGGSLAAGQSWSTGSGGSSGTGHSFDGSVAVKHTMGPWLIAGSFGVAGEWSHSNRIASLPTGTALLQSDPRALLVGGLLRGAYDFAFDGWYVRPYGDLAVYHSNMPNFAESGSSSYALNVHGSSNTNVEVSPMVEIGGRYAIDAADVLRPYAAIGISYLPNNSRTIGASLVGASAADGTFQTLIQSPTLLGDLDIGVQLYRSGGFEFKAEYTMQVGGSLLSMGGSARIAYHF